MSHESHWDETVWDPTNPEQAIEDPIHGAEARLKLLSTPPFPNEDGTYHVFGAYYVCGTTSFDADGNPFIRLGRSTPTMSMVREAQQHMDWVDKWQAGELPPIEEMGYPIFKLDARPYIFIDRL